MVFGFCVFLFVCGVFVVFFSFLFGGFFHFLVRRFSMIVRSPAVLSV